MGFLSPLFLVGLLAAAVPIALHLFRRQAGPDVPFSAVRFVPRAALPRRQRRRLQDVLLLALRVAAVVLLAVSFARPYLTAAPAGGEAPIAVVAIDRSYSLSAPGRMERAHELALGAIDEAAAGERIAVVAFDERAEVLQPPTSDRGAARRAVAAVSAGFAATRFDAAVAAAAELTGGGAGRLIVVSDLQQGGWPEGSAIAVPESLPIEARSVGPAPGNLAVGPVRRTPDGVAAEVRSTDDADRTARVVLSLDGRTAGEQSVTVPAGGSADVAFRAALPAAAAVAVQVEDATGYTADNVRYAVLDPAPSRRALAVVNPGAAGDALYLTKAISAAEGPDGMVIETRPADRLLDGGERLEGYEAIVLLGSRGFDARAGAALGEALAAGSGLLIVAGPQLDWPWLSSQLPASLGAAASGVETAPAPLALAATDIRHPVFQPSGTGVAGVGGARFRRILRLSDGGERVLARFTNGAPALVELGSGPARALLLASDLSNAWNDLVLQPAFVPFAHALVRHISSGRPPVRDLLVGARPGPRWAQPGVVAGDPGAAEDRVAVNVDLRESAAAQLTEAAFVAAVPRGAAPVAARAAREARAREREQSWWWYGLLLMLGGLLVESVVGRARRTEVEA